MKAMELAESVLAWWNEHKYDCAGERNLYDDPPDFVVMAAEALDLDIRELL